MFLIKQVVDQRGVTDLSLMKMKEGMQLKIDIIKSTRVRLTNKHGSILSEKNKDSLFYELVKIDLITLSNQDLSELLFQSLLCCHVATSSYSHVILSCSRSHVVILPCCHVSHEHCLVAILPCCHVQCHVAILPCRHVVMSVLN